MVNRPKLSSKKLLKLTDRGAEYIIQTLETQVWETISKEHPQLVPAMTKLSHEVKPAHALRTYAGCMNCIKVIVANRRTAQHGECSHRPRKLAVLG